MDVTQCSIRPARADDYDGVVAFTQDTWPDREGSDYLPDIYHEWIDGDPERTQTLIADVGDAIAGICQLVMLSDHEAWAQGMRVNPDFRGDGISTKLNHALFDWATEQGATVCRNMVFSWNGAGLGGSRSIGFEPVTEFRWAQPAPESVSVPETVVSDPTLAWQYWENSPARTHLSGLALDTEESWALSSLTRENLSAAAEDGGVYAVVDDSVRAMTCRTAVRTRENADGETETTVEYGVGAWDDLQSAQALFDAIRADAAELGADGTRVLIPETARAVSDAAYLRATISDEPDFVLGADLSDW